MAGGGVRKEEKPLIRCWRYPESFPRYSCFPETLSHSSFQIDKFLPSRIKEDTPRGFANGHLESQKKGDFFPEEWPCFS